MKIIFILVLLLDIGNILSNHILFDIVSGEPKTINYPGWGHNYYFSLPAKLNDKGFIAITHNKKSAFFEILRKHEFSSYSRSYRESSVIDLVKNKKYTKNIIDDKIIISFPFEISNSKTKYFGIEIKGTYNLKYLTVYLLLGENSYNIKLDSLNVFNNLITGIPYFYYIPATFKQNFTININTSCTTKKFIDEINIYEYKSKGQKELLLSKKAVESKSSQKQIYLYFNYIVSKESTNYIAFEVMPYYDLDYINLEITEN